MTAAEWVKGGGDTLGFLPFPLEEALLPGETKQVHLYEARFIQLFSECAAKHNNCLGTMYFTPNNGVSAITSLLEVEEFEKEEYGVWARLKCVGRLKIQELRQTEFEYIEGIVELFTDSDGDDASGSRESADGTAAEDSESASARAAAEAAVAEAVSAAAVKAGVSASSVAAAAEEMLMGLDEQVCEVHASIVEMESRLNGISAPADKPADPLQEAEAAAKAKALGLTDLNAAKKGERVEWGHELRNPDGEEATASMEELVSKRRSVLLSTGADSTPRETLCDGLASVWGVESEAAADRQLLSFAAAATLSPTARAIALGMSSPTERLTSALTSLREQQRRVSALLALRNAMPPSASSPAD